MKRVLIALAAAAAIAAPATGCGGNAKDTYRSESQKAAAAFRKQVAAAGAKIPAGANLRRRVPGLQAYRRSVDALAKKLSGLEPPKEAAKLHDTAVADVQSLSRDLARFESAAKANDAAAAQPVAVRLAQDQGRLQRALAAIDRKLGG